MWLTSSTYAPTHLWDLTDLHHDEVVHLREPPPIVPHLCHICLLVWDAVLSRKVWAQSQNVGAGSQCHATHLLGPNEPWDSSCNPILGEVSKQCGEFVIFFCEFK